MGLPPLEYIDCFLDSPTFREIISLYEKELESNAHYVKQLVKECRHMIQATEGSVTYTNATNWAMYWLCYCLRTYRPLCTCHNKTVCFVSCIQLGHNNNTLTVDIPVQAICVLFWGVFKSFLSSPQA